MEEKRDCKMAHRAQKKLDALRRKHRTTFKSIAQLQVWDVHELFTVLGPCSLSKAGGARLPLQHPEDETEAAGQCLEGRRLRGQGQR